MLNNPVILVCTDFSPPSDYAMKSAENIRRRVGGKVHALHVSDFPVHWEWISVDLSSPLFGGDVEITLLNSLKKLMREQVQRCELECTTEVSLGQVYQGIQETIDKVKPDLVILGHRGRASGPFQLGSMAAKIIASCKKPVLVSKKVLNIPLEKVAGLVSTIGPMQDIIAATEEFSFLLSAEPEIVSLWKNLSVQYFNLTTLLKSYPLLSFEQEEKDLIMAKMRERINEALDVHSKCKVRVDVTDEKHVAYQLARILHEDEVDLAIMGRHQKGMMEKLLIGSETRRMLEFYHGNILVLPPPTLRIERSS